VSLSGLRSTIQHCHWNCPKHEYVEVQGPRVIGAPMVQPVLTCIWRRRVCRAVSLRMHCKTAPHSLFLAHCATASCSVEASVMDSSGGSSDSKGLHAKSRTHATSTSLQESARIGRCSSPAVGSASELAYNACKMQAKPNIARPIRFPEDSRRTCKA
jgi:hypothetical protein